MTIADNTFDDVNLRYDKPEGRLNRCLLPAHTNFFPMIRLLIVLILTLFSTATLKSQFLYLTELVNFVTGTDMESTAEKLSSGNWSLLDTETDEANGVRFDAWSYGIDYSEYYDEYSSVTPAYLNLISREGTVTGLYYTVFEFDLYNRIFSSLKDNGFRKDRSKEFRDSEVNVYTDGRLLLMFNAEEVTPEEDPESSYTAYTIYLADRSQGLTEGGDGPRQEFYPTGELLAEYTLRAGEPHGVVKVYDQKGHVVQEANYRDGELHGTRKFWFPSVDQNTGLPIEEAGELYLVSNYSGGLQHGTETWYYQAGYESFPCEKTDSTGAVVADTCRMLVITREKEIINYRNDMLHGEYIKYDEKGEVVSKGRYKKGMMVGKWYNKPEEDDI